MLIFKTETKILIESDTNKTRKLPDAIIIGVSKCGINTIKLSNKYNFNFKNLLSGTDTLVSFIEIHPDIKAAEGEVNFFDQYYENGFEWYR